MINYSVLRIIPFALTIREVLTVSLATLLLAGAGCCCYLAVC